MDLRHTPHLPRPIHGDPTLAALIVALDLWYYCQLDEVAGRTATLRDAYQHWLGTPFEGRAGA